jgi:hypothetical protein
MQFVDVRADLDPGRYVKGVGVDARAADENHPWVVEPLRDVGVALGTKAQEISAHGGPAD